MALRARVDPPRLTSPSKKPRQRPSKTRIIHNRITFHTNEHRRFAEDDHPTLIGKSCLLNMGIGSYFQTLLISFITGRDFDSHDNHSASSIVHEFVIRKMAANETSQSKVTFRR